MSRQKFYDRVAKTLFKGSLPDWQRRPLDLLIDEGVKRGRLLTECAYVLATAYWETGRFKHMEEIGRGRGRDYGASMLLIRGRQVTYHGRGFVQLTWLINYLRMERKLGIKIVDNPDLVMEPEIACQIIWQGMIDGDFTGQNLADYISDGEADYRGARKIINGTDKDEEIAGFAIEFEAALRLIDDTSQEVAACPSANPMCPLHAAA